MQRLTRALQDAILRRAQELERDRAALEVKKSLPVRPSTSCFSWTRKGRCNAVAGCVLEAGRARMAHRVGAQGAILGGLHHDDIVVTC